MKTIVYVDGFNLYYGAVKGTAYKWLDIPKMCRLLLPKNDIIKVKYFTARVSARAGDPDQPTRQDAFLRALGTLADVEIVLGRFLTSEVTRRIAKPAPGGPRYCRVIKTEEKGSDVNLATHLLRDAFLDQLEVAVLVTNDSDLAEPVRIVRSELNKPVGILNPHKRPSHELRKYATFIKPIRRGVLEASQFPPQLRDARGLITKPAKWP
jgi:uncharacterized LabA/DUF88 family protein